MRMRPRVVLPAVLLVLGTTMLSGCIYLPTFGLGSAGKDLSGLVGGPDSGRPLRERTATAADVVRLLGHPPYASPDGRRIGYGWRRTHGLWLGVLCASPDETYSLLILDFDGQGVLHSALVRPFRPFVEGFKVSTDNYAFLNGMRLIGPGWSPPPPETRPTTDPADPADPASNAPDRPATGPRP